MFVHAFGAYFGLAVTFVLYRRMAYCVNRQSNRKNEANNDPIRSTFSASVGKRCIIIIEFKYPQCKHLDDKNRNHVLVALVA